MRLVFAGTPAVALPALEAIAASGHDLLAVVTRPDAPAGRGRRLVRSPVAAWADERGIEVLTPAKPREPEFLDRLNEIAPDCVPVVEGPVGDPLPPPHAPASKAVTNVSPRPLRMNPPGGPRGNDGARPRRWRPAPVNR